MIAWSHDLIIADDYCKQSFEVQQVLDGISQRWVCHIVLCRSQCEGNRDV